MGKIKVAKTCITIRLNEEIKAKAVKAVALLGMKSLTEYVVKLIEDNATKVIAEHESISIKHDIFDHFMKACDEAKSPNKSLVNAVSYAKKVVC